MYILQQKKTKGLLAAVAQGRALPGKGEAESSNLSGSTSISWHEKCSYNCMKKIVLLSLFLFIVSCAPNNLNNDFDQLFSEDYYLGAPGSKLFYRTTSRATQEKYHYSECKKKLLNGDQLKIESCVSAYWLKAKSKRKSLSFSIILSNFVELY